MNEGQKRPVLPLAAAILTTGPLVGIAFAVVLSLSLGALDEAGGTTDYLLEMFPAFTIFGALIGVPVVVVAGLPVHSFLMRRNWRSVWHYLLAGSILGAVPGIWTISVRLIEGETPDPFGATYIAVLVAFVFVIFGLLGGAIFWLIRRPDREEPTAHMPQPPAA